MDWIRNNLNNDQAHCYARLKGLKEKQTWMVLTNWTKISQPKGNFTSHSLTCERTHGFPAGEHYGRVHIMPL